jgi:lipopolysaccharide biosynthesis regulator YciM
MKRIALAALLALGSPFAAAQAVAPMNCGATPEYPGRLGSDTQKRVFDKAYRTYDSCVRAYVEERKVAIKANEEAAARAIDEFNALVNKMRADSGEDMSKDKAGAAPAAPKTGSKY